MSDLVVFVADAGEEAGLGHIGRSSAIAVALGCRGIDTRCFAHGAHEALICDGITWLPVDKRALLDSEINVLVIDSYRLRHEDLPASASSIRRVVMHDYGAPPKGVAMVVSMANPGAVRGKVLSGFLYAALRPSFWGLPGRALGEGVERVLISTGSGHYNALGIELARALAIASPTTAVSLVRGPYASGDTPVDVETIDAPDSLFDALLAADLVITAGGQTMLEAAAAGTPCVALPLVENQRPQLELLSKLGVVRPVDPPNAREVVGAALALIQDRETRQALSVAGQRAVDGYGALRVAFEIARLAGNGR